MSGTIPPIDVAAFEAEMLTIEPETPNVLTPELGGSWRGATRTEVAEERLRSICQNLIRVVYEHRHLKLGAAKILLLTEAKEATAKKLAKGGRVALGRASRAGAGERLLSGEAEDERADFVIRLSDDWIRKLQGDRGEEAWPMIIALIDHELCHCGCKIAGEFVHPAEVEAYVSELGQLHIETCEDVTDEQKRVLVRSIHIDKDADKPVWAMRKHDVEEFEGIVKRHGAWDRLLERLVDVLIEHEEDEEPRLPMAS